MSFASPEFIILFVSVLVLYYALPPAGRNPLLLIASAAFYMWWRPEYVVLILFSVTVDYFVALGLRADAAPGRRRLLLVVSLVTNLGLLFFFKYFSFAADSLRATLGLLKIAWEPPLLKLVLPIGISFHTFQALSYTIDVYRGQIPVERNLGKLWLYVLFFPQLVAGPIERAGSLLPQFGETHAPNPEQIVSGVQRILWGLVKKVAIADRLALLADRVYDSPADFSQAQILIATYAFAFQIYADFSGYTDVAIGAAQALGFRLRENFDRPYLAASPVEFWRRWHISLSTWFRDYVYVPMGGNRQGPGRWILAILLTFALSGLWHGARWTFVLWGVFHGVLLAATRLLGRRGWGARLPGWLKILATFHLVLLGWVLFRASSLADAWTVVRGALGLLHPAAEAAPFARKDLILAALGLVGLFAAETRVAVKWPVAVRWAAYVAGALLVLNARPAADLPFIYFQF
jgi:D-alanyl-lipoteichoic acid acyltransferase DltB (MBOAT superfamily)